MTTPSFTPNDGEIIVVKAQGSHGDATLFSAPTGGGLTYTQQQNSDSVSHDRIALWTAPVVGSPGSMSVSLTAPAAGAGTNARSMVVERWAGGKLTASPVSVLTEGTNGTPSTTLTTTQPNSIVSWVNSDWNAVDGASRAYLTTSAIPVEEGYDFVAADHTGEFAYQLASNIAAQTFGLSAPAGQ